MVAEGHAVEPEELAAAGRFDGRRDCTELTSAKYLIAQL